MNRTALSLFEAQLLLARSICLAVAITLYIAFAMLVGSGVAAAPLLLFLLFCMAPPAATLGLLFAGRRRLASCVALLGTAPCTALFLAAIIPLVGSPGLYLGWIERAVSTLPFLYTSITLARVGVGVRVTAGERRERRHVRAARRAAALPAGTAPEQQTPTA